MDSPNYYLREALICLCISVGIIVYIVTLNWLRPIENHLHTTEEQYTTPTIPDLPKFKDAIPG